MRQKCARRRHFSFLSTELDLGGLLELLEEMEVGVDNVLDLLNIDETGLNFWIGILLFQA